MQTILMILLLSSTLVALTSSIWLLLLSTKYKMPYNEIPEKMKKIENVLEVSYYFTLLIVAIIVFTNINQF